MSACRVKRGMVSLVVRDMYRKNYVKRNAKLKSVFDILNPPKYCPCRLNFLEEVKTSIESPG